jgi:hypothetical protein
MPGNRSPRAISRPAATAASQCTPTHSAGTWPNASSQRCCDVAPPRNTSSMMIRAPARTIATTPTSHTCSSSRNSGPTVTDPSAEISSPSADDVNAAGMASVRLSVPKVSHGCGNTACRHRASPDFPLLDPPLSTINLVDMAAAYGRFGQRQSN